MWRASGRGGAGSDRSEGLGDVRDPGLLPEVEYRTGVLRQQAVPGPTRSSGLERAECGAGAPDGVVRGDTDGPVVCRQWSCRCAGGSAALVVSAQGDADVQRHAGGVAVADVAASGFWGFRCRGALTRMPRNATPDALRCGIVVRNTSTMGPSRSPAARNCSGIAVTRSRHLEYRSYPGCSGSAPWSTSDIRTG